MSRPLLAVTLSALVLALLPVAGNATHSNGSGPKEDFAIGTGHFEGVSPLGQTVITMHVNARSKPSGEDARGHFVIKRELPTELRQRGTVTCLNVVGNQAVVGGRIESGTASGAGGGFLFQFDDSGNATDISDRMHGSPTQTPPTICPNPTAAARLPVQLGNFVVHDSAP